MALDKIFNDFTHGAPNMDGRTFIKLCKDSQLFCKLYTPTDGDLVFAKVKPKGGKTINYSEFETAIQHVSEKKKLSLQDLITKLSNTSATPKYSGTIAQPNKFHDDKSLYTGVHANGGPSTSGGNGVGDLGNLLDRSAANVRGVKM